MVCSGAHHVIIRRDGSGFSGDRWSVLGGAGGLGCGSLIDVAHLSSKFKEHSTDLLDVWSGFLLFAPIFLRGIAELLVAAPGY